MRVIAEATPAAAMSKRTSGAPRGPVHPRRAVDGAGEPEVGPDGVGDAPAAGRDARRRCRSVSSIRPCAVRLPSPKSSVERRQLDRAAADRHGRRRGQRRRDALLAQAQRVERSRRSRRRAASARPRGRRACRSRAGRLAANCIGRRVDSGSAVALSERRPRRRRRRGRCRSSVPLTSGRPSASADRRALASSWPMRVPPTRRRAPRGQSIADPLAGLGRRRASMSASTAPVASTSASAASGAMSGACERQAARRPGRCRSWRGRRSAGSGRPASSSPESERPLADDGDVAGERQDEPVEPAAARRGCR